MEFIEPEEFLKEDKEVQEVINNSIKLNIGDRIYHKLSKKYYIYLGEYNEVFWNVFDLEDKCTSVVCKDYFYRCLCEGQLRKFIEDKTGYKISKVFLNKFEVGEESLKRYYIHLANFRIFMNQSNDLLQAYWKVAVQIAKENIDN